MTAAALDRAGRLLAGVRPPKLRVVPLRCVGLRMVRHGTPANYAPALYEARPRTSDGSLSWRLVEPFPERSPSRWDAGIAARLRARELGIEYLREAVHGAVVGSGVRPLRGRQRHAEVVG